MLEDEGVEEFLEAELSRRRAATAADSRAANFGRRKSTAAGSTAAGSTADLSGLDNDREIRFGEVYTCSGMAVLPSSSARDGQPLTLAPSSGLATRLSDGDVAVEDVASEPEPLVFELSVGTSFPLDDTRIDGCRIPAGVALSSSAHGDDFGVAPVFFTAILAYGARDGSVCLGEWGGVLETGEYLTPTCKELLRARDGSREPAEDLSAAASRIATVVSLGVSKAERSRAVATLELAASAWASISMMMSFARNEWQTFVREAGLPLVAHVWNSSQLVASYVLTRTQAQHPFPRDAPITAPFTDGAYLCACDKEVGGVEQRVQAWCQAAMRAWVGPLAR